MTRMTPFRMIGNIYFIGTYEASSHLIDTGDGLILIDTGYEENAETVIESMSALGFDPADVKYILHSHGHYDHTDATHKLIPLMPNAKTYLSFKDIKYIKYFTPDCDIKDGDVIKLGNTEVLCLFTPGHTEGSVSFFINVEEDGKIYRAAMFGGSGTNQLKKAWMHKYDVPYLCRGEFFDSVDRLLAEHVDVMIGNHAWQNRTPEKYEMMATAQQNPFIDPTEWAAYLKKLRGLLEGIILTESRELFVTYAHRGASEYRPENTLSAFDLGLEMGANGIECDIQRTKDGALVIFHDDTLERVSGEAGSISDYTLAELKEFDVKHGELTDKIPTLEEFLTRYAERDITFAIELKIDDTERDVADMIFKYGIERKCTVTSFELERLKKIHAYAPTLRIGYLAREISDDIIAELIALGADEFCPEAKDVTAERVAAWHRLGFNVRAWGVANEELMKNVYDSGADGMTVNFPDRLIKYIANQSK